MVFPPVYFKAAANTPFNNVCCSFEAKQNFIRTPRVVVWMEISHGVHSNRNVTSHPASTKLCVLFHDCFFFISFYFILHLPKCQPHFNSFYGRHSTLPPIVLWSPLFLHLPFFISFKQLWYLFFIGLSHWWLLLSWWLQWANLLQPTQDKMKNWLLTNLVKYLFLKKKFLEKTWEVEIWKILQETVDRKIYSATVTGAIL